MNEKIFKIKDSVDLFLSDEKFIVAYYMNSRQKKTFKVNNALIKLLENLDGKKTVDEIKMSFTDLDDVDITSIEDALNSLESAHIVTEVYKGEEILTFDDQKRYSRQINYFAEFLKSEKEGILAQKKVIDSHIVILGCGAIGGGIAIELAMAGVKQFTLYDYDVVERSDISRHIYYDEKNVGMKKVESLKEAILNINHDCKVNCINNSMKPSDDINDIIRSATLVVNTLDEPYIGYTSSKISRICIKFNIPHYIAGGFDAHLASTGEIIVPYLTPCVECYAGHFKKVLENWKPLKHPVQVRFMEVGGLASMSLFSVSYACIEIIKYIAGIMNYNYDFKTRGELLFKNLELSFLNVKRNKDCIICGEGSIL